MSCGGTFLPGPERTTVTLTQRMKYTMITEGTRLSPRPGWHWCSTHKRWERLYEWHRDL